MMYVFFHCCAHELPLKTMPKTCDPAEFSELCERTGGRTLLLAYPKTSAAEVEEVIMRIQGYLVDLSLPPVRQHQ